MSDKLFVISICEEEFAKQSEDTKQDILDSELVLCKDCKHRYISGNGTTRYYVCDFMDAQYEDNGFCHHGKRKGGVI